MITDADVRKVLHAEFSMGDIVQYLNERNRAISKAKEDKTTLRDHFAGQAVQGLCKSITDYGWPIEVVEGYAVQAYAIADAMLAEREK